MSSSIHGCNTTWYAIAIHYIYGVLKLLATRACTPSEITKYSEGFYDYSVEVQIQTDGFDCAEENIA